MSADLLTLPPIRFRLTRDHGGSFGYACQSVLQTGGQSWRRCGAKTDAILHIGGNDIQQAMCTECLRARHPELLEKESAR